MLIPAGRHGILYKGIKGGIMRLVDTIGKHTHEAHLALWTFCLESSSQTRWKRGTEGGCVGGTDDAMEKRGVTSRLAATAAEQRLRMTDVTARLFNFIRVAASAEARRPEQTDRERHDHAARSGR